MQADVPGRVDVITAANWRRVEIDAFRAWALGEILQRNPQNAAETYAVNFNFDASRYQTAATAWNDGSLNAYDELTAWLEDAVDAVGPIEGILSRRNVITEIKRDAPALAGGAEMTMAQLEDRLSQDLGFAFRFFQMEDSVDEFTDGGIVTARNKVWAAEKVAVVPQGVTVGYTAMAPVVRAMEIARALPAAGIDQNGQTVYYEEHNNGRQLSVEVQVNALPIPEESNVYVIDVGF
jgi:hypothetical protein